MMRFTPIVAVANGPNDPLGMPDALLLDLTGCERVFHGLDRLVRQIVASLDRFQLDARIAVGPNPGAAWAITFAPEGHGVADATRPHGPVDLNDVPCEALRLDNDAVAKLYHLGIRTIGQLLAVPRGQLLARFGKELTLRLDQLSGLVSEPIVPLDPPDVIASGMDFDGVVTSLEAIWIVFRELLGRVIARLERRGRGVRELDVTFIRAYAPPLFKTIRLSRPSRDPVNLFNLFRCATERMADDNDGSDEFLGLRLLARVHESLPDEQISLLDGEHYAGEMELDRLIERLCARLGERSVTQAQTVEAHVPERATRRRLARDTRARPDTRARSANQPAGPEHLVDPRERHPPTNVRPLRLLARPLEVPVMVSPPFSDSLGRPIQFVARGGHVHQLAHVVGPERIGGQWWNAHDKTRDYFDVEDAAGERFWLFRVNETHRWFLHGRFA